MTTYYFDYAAGADANSGLTTAAPKKTMPALVALIAAGHTFRLKRGVAWPVEAAFGDTCLDVGGLSLAGLCTISDYGSALEPPTLNALEFDVSASGWSHAGSGIWNKTHAAQVDRVILGGTMASLGIGGLSHAASAAVNGTHQWWWSGSTLKIYTGSTTISPPIFYGGLSYVSATGGGGVTCRSSRNLLFERIRTYGGSDAGWNFGCTSADTTDIALVDCEARYLGIGSGMKIRSLSGAYANRRITLTRPIVDLRTNATENEGTAARMGGSDGFLIAHNYDAITITDPTASGFRHAGLNCYDEVGKVPGSLVVTAGVSYGVFDSRNIEYGRALGCVGSIASQSTRISGIKSLGQVTRSQFSGTVHISGCTWKEMRYDATILGYESSQAIWFQSWDLGPGNSKMVDVVFQNNLIENPWSCPIVFAKGTATAGSFDANKIKVYNNTIVDVTHHGYLGRQSISDAALGFGAPAFQLVQNNNLITPSAVGSIQVTWGGVTSTINGTTGFSGNVENVEGYVDRTAGDYTPLVLGGLRFTGLLGLVDALDSAGALFGATPSIAPTEYVGAAGPVLPTALAAHLQRNTTTMATALLIVREDGAVYGFTSHDVDDEIDGVMYWSSPGLDVTSIEISANAAVGNLELTTLHDQETFTTIDLIGGKWRNAQFTIFRYNFESLTDGTDLLLVGTIGEFTINRETLIVELRDLRQYLQQAVGDLSSKTCRARLGDARCRFDVEATRVTGALTTVTSNRVFADSSRAEADDYFSEGEITWITGFNAGLSTKVKTYSNAGGTYTLALPMFAHVQIGDTYSAIPGCRKRLEEDCRDKFDNVLNFVGEPHRAGLNSLTSAPGETIQQ